MARRGKVEVTEDEKQNEISYLQPEILPVQVMVDVLKERGMKSATLQQVHRAQIIALFYKHVSPKHQRDYRDNRRGKILKKSRQRKEIKIKDEDWKKLVIESKNKVESKDRLLSVSTNAALSSSDDKERLKPPPSCINAERKKIKLGSSTKTSGDLDFIVIKRRSSEESESAPDNKVKRLSQEEADTKDKRKETDEPQKDAKKQKVENGQEKQTSDLDSSEDGKKEKVKRKLISWP